MGGRNSCAHPKLMTYSVSRLQSANHSSFRLSKMRMKRSVIEKDNGKKNEECEQQAYEYRVYEWRHSETSLQNQLLWRHRLEFEFVALWFKLCSEFNKVRHEMNEWCFRPRICMVRYTGQGTIWLIRWILLWIMPLVQDRSLDLLTSYGRPLNKARARVALW